jgi:hypothetical protein
MSKHTSGPWVLRENNAVDRILPPGELRDPEAPYILSQSNYDSANWRDNARRAVDCVNACEGINPEAIPELLKAAKGLLTFMRNGIQLPEKDRLAAAVVKAEKK